MTAYACLKNEFTEDQKYHNLMGWLKCTILNLASNIPSMSHKLPDL